MYSMYRGLPVGSILVWKAPARFRYYLRKAAGVLPPHNPRCREIWYLIDGQQRLAVLYQTQHGGKVVNSYGREVDFTHIHFALDGRRENCFVRMRNSVQGEYVRVCDILAANWRKRIKHLPAYKQKRVKVCRDRILDYRIPVPFMQASQPELVRETFLRINSGGMRVSAADKAFAKASRLDLRRLVNELRGGLPRGYQHVDPRTIQFAASLMLGLREVKGRAIDGFLARMEDKFIVDRKVSGDFTPLWNRIHHSLAKAIDLLSSEVGVPNYEFLPSSTMLVTLSQFFFSSSNPQPTPNQVREIRKWFWATAVGGRYSGRGYYQNILADVRFFERLAKLGNARFQYGGLTAVSDLERAEYRGSSSLTKAFFLLLQRCHPLFLENARPIPLGETASLKNRNDKHHIFPKALLGRHGVSDREADRLCNICYMVAEDNQSFGSKQPIKYLAGYRFHKRFGRVMRSHLIPHEKNSGLWDANTKRGFRTFVRNRVNVARKALEDESGMKLFRKD